MQAEIVHERPRTRGEPFLKWAGGKRRLLDRILPELPAFSGRYYEPFLGGGAVFFALRPARATLADINLDLINTFASVRDNVDSVVANLQVLGYNSAAYYRVRSSHPRGSAARAARFIFLNKTCFNGLFRVNTRGEFNVPFGRHGSQLMTCDIEQLRSASDALQGVSLRAADFEAVVSRARPGDLVYFDPPYTTAHTNNGFIEYNARVFSWSDQRRLARIARALLRRGVFVVLSNADHPAIRSLYGNGARFSLGTLERASTVASGPAYRFAATELLICGRPVRKRRAGD